MAVNLKMRRASTATEILMLLLLMVAILTSIICGSAQQAQQTCAAKLVPCANSLNMTNPPDTCCEPLRDALTNDLPCLCSIFNDPNILKAFKIDPKLATQLPKHCGMPSFSTTNACANTTTGPSASTPPEEKQKSIDIEIADELLDLVLGFQFRPQVDKLVAYLKSQHEYKVINMDQWLGFLRFCNEINFPSLDNYDPELAWPLILDNFVEWMRG